MSKPSVSACTNGGPHEVPHAHVPVLLFHHSLRTNSRLRRLQLSRSSGQALEPQRSGRATVQCLDDTHLDPIRKGNLLEELVDFPFPEAEDDDSECE
jgi:hypothetical protein